MTILKGISLFLSPSHKRPRTHTHTFCKVLLMSMTMAAHSDEKIPVMTSDLSDTS